jgi:hypothetical protein
MKNDLEDSKDNLKFPIEYLLKQSLYFYVKRAGILLSIVLTNLLGAILFLLGHKIFAVKIPTIFIYLFIFSYFTVVSLIVIPIFSPLSMEEMEEEFKCYLLDKVESMKKNNKNSITISFFIIRNTIAYRRSLLIESIKFSFEETTKIFKKF